MNRVYIKTYGCQMNERDSDAVAALLRARGYSFVDSEEDADVILINTCSVRDLSEQKALGKMGRLQKLKKKNPRLVLGIMGCMAQSRGSGLLDKLPELDLVVGTQKLHRVPEHLAEILKTKDGLGPLPAKLVDISEEADSQNAIKDHQESGSVTSFVSIQQGCDMNCAFCIVPHVRGDERSRPMEEILEEIRGLAVSGSREITLLGQIVTSYGRGLENFKDKKSPFVQLLERLEEIEGIKRVRFTSPHPRGFKEDLVGCFGRLEKLCESVHLPMQSGSDRILRLMNRPYGRDRYYDIVQSLRARVPDIYLSTDIIVGFPGETDEDFEATRELFDRVGYDMAFIFKYSKRSGTPAAQMKDQVSDEVKEMRNQALLDILHKSSLRRGESLLDTTQEVLVEGWARKGGKLMGRNRGGRKVFFKGDGGLIGQLVNVKIDKATVAVLEGNVV
jgi:tRNA-2-methylthio-N6-dimethylallyladenosine synthase